MPLKKKSQTALLNKMLAVPDCREVIAAGRDFPCSGYRISRSGILYFVIGFTQIIKKAVFCSSADGK